MKKSTFKGYHYEYDKRFPIYEYRGETYTINPYLYTSTADQHRTEQSTIDGLIERREACEKRDREMEKRGGHKETAREELKAFFDMINEK